MAKKVKSDVGNMDVSTFVADGVRVFSNATTLDGETLYAWEVVDPITKQIVFKQPFTTNPIFAYAADKCENMNVVAKIKGDVELVCLVYEAQIKPLEDIKVMFARRSNFFRFTNVTDIEGLKFLWQVQVRQNGKRVWKDIADIVGNADKVFEYTFEKENDYRVVAHISTDFGGYGSRVVAEITSADLEMPKGF